MTRPSAERDRLSKKCLKLRLKLRQEIGRREAFLEINQEFENDFSYIKQVDGQIRLRETKSACIGELALRNRLFQEDHARDCHEIEESRRICCEETDRARQARIDELSMHQEESYVCESINDSDAKITQQSKLLVRRERILRSPIREQLWSNPRSRSNLYYYESQNLCRTVILVSHVIRKMVRILQETFLNRPPAQEGLSCTIFRNSKNLASSFQELRPDTVGTARKRESEMKRESLSTSVPLLHFQSRSGMLNHTGGSYSHSGMMAYPKIPFSKLNLVKLPDFMEHQSWKVGKSTSGLRFV